MTSKLPRSQRQLVLLSIIYIVLYLWYQHATTGIGGHYLLHNTALPFFSDSWGLVIVPLVTIGLTCWINQQRPATCHNYPPPIWHALAISGAFAAVVSLAFFSGYASQVAALSLPIMLLLGMLLPTYRPAYLLGYYLVSTVGFGAVIPLIGTAMLGLTGLIGYKLFRPLLLKIILHRKV